MSGPRTPSGSRLVYSTGAGRLCPDCGQPRGTCRCGARAAAAVVRPKGPVRVGRETQGRGGKGVTVVAGLALAPAELEQLARELKQRCGSGGTVRDGVIEIQGEHRDTVVAELARRGIEAKRSGG
jgi:translation initiation factor 1